MNDAALARQAVEDACRALVEMANPYPTDHKQGLERASALLAALGGDPPREAAKPGACRSCNAPVLFVHNARSRKVQILNAAKTVVWISTAMGALSVTGHLDHHATCPHAQAWRKPKAP